MSLPSVELIPERSIVAARIVVALWLVGWTSKCVLLLEYFLRRWSATQWSMIFSGVLSIRVGGASCVFAAVVGAARVCVAAASLVLFNGRSHDVVVSSVASASGQRE